MRQSEDYFICQQIGKAHREFERKAVQERARTGGSNPEYNEKKKQEMLRKAKQMQSYSR